MLSGCPPPYHTLSYCMPAALLVLAPNDWGMMLSSCLAEQCPRSQAAFLPQFWQLKPECPQKPALLPLPAGLEPAQVPDHLQAVHVDLKLSQVKTVSFLTYLVRRLPQQVGVVRGRSVMGTAHTDKC